jgi:ribosomal RNA-processing protein 12
LANHSSKEIAKSAFRFIKASCLAFPKDVVNSSLVSLVAISLQLAESYGAEFKVPVRHLLQVLCRDFDIVTIDALVPETHKKLIHNIKKRQERRKKRKELDAEDSTLACLQTDSKDKLASVSLNRNTSTSFDDVVYGDSSDSEAEDHTSESNRIRAKSSSRIYLQENGDVPVDFLDRSVVSKVYGKSALILFFVYFFAPHLVNIFLRNYLLLTSLFYFQMMFH